ncbi:MAG: hypothetical protein K0S32_3287 [Bacteroidetes bacterium]|jgi:hypothetical protein|nr:hypothetical protein [Bacteroidota bacterium]
MKTNFNLILLLSLFLSPGFFFSQNDSTKNNSKVYVVTKNDGTTFVGKIISQDAREVLMDTKNIGQVAIPKHEIKSVEELQGGDLNSKGDYIPKEVFSTRYFITTNGLPIQKGESYVQWNLYGPDFQFGVSKNFGLGIMTSWFAIPVIGTAKYSIRFAEKVHLGLGVLAGTGSWALPDFAIALPFGALTLGDRRANISVSAGYGAVITDNDNDGRTLASIAGMVKVSKRISLVFDSFWMLPGGERKIQNYAHDPNGNYYTYYTTQKKPGFALIIPGIRWQSEPNKAFQFGFTGVIVDGNTWPVPIPMVQWYRKI